MTEEEIQARRERWEKETRDPSLRGKSVDPEAFRTDSGIPVEEVYAFFSDPELARTGFPGEFPFTRGVHPTMYRGRPWTMRQYAGFGTAEESNKRYRYLIDHGTTGLSVAFDLPTQIGYDSDHAMAEGEVGKVGVAIDSIDDMRRLFDGIALDKVSTSMTINATAPILLALYVAHAQGQGIEPGALSGTVQNDILKEYAARGTYIFPPAPSLRFVTDVFEWCSGHMPRWNTISVSGYHIREAGSTAVQELAFTLANAIAYVQSAVDRGLDADVVGKQISFFFNAHNTFFEEVAKFRAARRLWAHIMKDRFGAQRPESMKLRFHAQTGGSTLTAQQIDTNVVRVTIQALAAVLGGCQSLHTNSRDEALALPTEDSARLALRTQQVIAYETGVTHTVDPLGGSFFVESLTDEMERHVLEYLDKIDGMGGAVRAIEKSFIQSEIAASSYAYQKSIEQGSKTIVGVNAFTMEEDVRPELHTIDPSLQKRQIERVRAHREQRNARAWETSMKEVRECAVEGRNLMPALIPAVIAGATVGEISGVLREVWGEYDGG